jgi:hypothetical protein
MSNTNPRVPTRRPLFGALLLVAFVVAVLAGSALAASLVKNGSFEKDGNGDGLPNNWVYDYNIASGDKRVCNQSYAGACSFKMVGDGKSKALYQIIPISGVSGDQFNLVIWTKGKDTDYGGGNIGWGLYFHNPEDGLWYLGAGDGNSDDGSSPWTLSSVYASATAPTFDSIKVQLYFKADSGKVWFDKVKLVAVPPPG